MDERRVRLLVSVRSADEAQVALAGGADLIDVKEPGNGALGMAERGVIASVVQAVGGAVPVSAALGELGDEVGEGGLDGVAYVKVGLAGAGGDWREKLRERVKGFAPARPIAVAYADWERAGNPGAPGPSEVLQWALENNAAGLLVDTYVKDGKGLFDWMKDLQLVSLIAAAQDAGLLVALAGGLRGEGIEHATAIRPDIVAVRGAVCVGGRDGCVEEEKVRGLASVIEEMGRGVGVAAD